MYKDRDRQREANRQAQARFKAKGITDNELEQAKGITNQGITGRVLPEGMTHNEGVVEFDNVEALLDDLHDTKPERTAQGNIRVSKPGDADYEGVA